MFHSSSDVGRRRHRVTACPHVLWHWGEKQVESRHVSNLQVCQHTDYDVFHWWYGDACIQEFLLQLEDWCRGGKQPLTVLAHNFQGYHRYPIIDTLHRLRLKLGQIRNGCKVLQLQWLASSVRFFQMSWPSSQQPSGWRNSDSRHLREEDYTISQDGKGKSPVLRKGPVPSVFQWACQKAISEYFSKQRQTHRGNFGDTTM